MKDKWLERFDGSWIKENTENGVIKEIEDIISGERKRIISEVERVIGECETYTGNFIDKSELLAKLKEVK